MESENSPKTLRLPSALLEEVYEHAARVYPKEGCGIFVGRREEGAWRAELFVPAQNLSAAAALGSIVPDREVGYSIDPKDRLRAEAQAKRLQGEVIGFYRSRPEGAVHFSKTDLENCEEVLLGEPWVEPAYAYLVVSLEQGKPNAHGAFRVIGGRSESIDVVLF